MKRNLQDSEKDKQIKLLALVQSWKINDHPEYRGFRCANCQKYMTDGAWHHLLTSGGYITQVHFCNNCEDSFNQSTPGTNEPRATIDKSKFKFECTQENQAILRKIIDVRKITPTDTYKVFTCDLCGEAFPKDEGYQKAYHVWCNIDENLVEFHFDERCFHELM